jgi:hypothetical protein
VAQSPTPTRPQHSPGPWRPRPDEIEMAIKTVVDGYPVAKRCSFDYSPGPGRVLCPSRQAFRGGPDTPAAILSLGPMVDA